VLSGNLLKEEPLFLYLELQPNRWLPDPIQSIKTYLISSTRSSSPKPSLRSETFTAPGQTNQNEQKQNSFESNNSDPSVNISGSNTPSSFTTSSLLGIGGASFTVEFQSKSKNKNTNSSNSGISLARPQRLKNL
jgi:hypothetical protein